MNRTEINSKVWEMKRHVDINLAASIDSMNQLESHSQGGFSC